MARWIDGCIDTFLDGLINKIIAGCISGWMNRFSEAFRYFRLQAGAGSSDSLAQEAASIFIFTITYKCTRDYQGNPYSNPCIPDSCRWCQ